MSYSTQRCAKCSSLAVIVAVAEPLLAGGAPIFRVKAQQEGCYSGCMWWISGILSSCSILVEVHGCLFKATATKCHISSISCLQLIVLPSLILKPANEMVLWIEEDLIYTEMCQSLAFDHSCSCCKGIFKSWQEVITQCCRTVQIL